MLRMEIALFLVLSFVAFLYFSAERKEVPLHRMFSGILIAMLIHLAFDGATIYTVNHLDTVPKTLNDLLHRLFIGSLVLCVCLFYQYIAILVEEETGKPRKLEPVAEIAQQSGYGDYRVFKKSEGITPSQYRHAL